MQVRTPKMPSHSLADFGVFTRRRHDKDPMLRVASFSDDPSWGTLTGHVKSEHPRGYERLVNMTSVEIAEAISRKK